MNLVIGGLCESLLVVGGFGGISSPSGPTTYYVDADAGTLLVESDTGSDEVDADAGTLIVL